MIPLGDARRRFGFPWMTCLLLAVGLIVFLYERRFPLDGLYGLRPAELGQRLGALQQAVGCLLVQGPGWLAPLVNLVYLWILGNKVEDACGPYGFFSLSLLCGLGGVVVAGFLAPYLPEEARLYGLAGVVAGLFGAYLTLYRGEGIRTLLPPIFLVRVPAFLHLLYWAGWEFVHLDLVALRAGKIGQILYPHWPFAGAFFLGLLAGPLFARSEFLWLRLKGRESPGLPAPGA